MAATRPDSPLLANGWTFVDSQWVYELGLASIGDIVGRAQILCQDQNESGSLLSFTIRFYTEFGEISDLLYGGQHAESIEELVAIAFEYLPTLGEKRAETLYRMAKAEHRENNRRFFRRRLYGH